MKVAIEITGADEVATKLAAVGDRLEQPLDSIFQAVADIWTTDFQENFKRQGSILTGPWQPLHERTQRIRKSRGFNPESPILQRTGDLLQSIGIVSQTGEELAVGTALRYAYILQEGGIEDYPSDEPGQRLIPARPFVVLHEELIADAVDAIDAFYFPEAADA